jgi:serine/threonine protein kinase
MFYDFFDEGDKLYVVLEYLPGGDLFSTLQKLQVYSEKDARDLTFVLLSALKHMHDLNIVHRDLKPENLLMKSAEVADVTIADFGFAAYCPEPTLTETCGTPAYVAPEVLSSTPYGKSADMWSLGVITYILLGGYAPFDGKDMKELFRHIKGCKYDFHDEYWSDISDNAKSFIKQLLVVDPKTRMTVDQALQHPWVKMAERDLVVKNLTKAIENFKSFNGKKKLKGAIRLVMASNTLKRFSFSQSQKAGDDEEGSAFHDSAEIEIGWDKESEAEAAGGAALASPQTTTSSSSSATATAATAVDSDYVQHSFSSRWIMGKKLGEGAFAEVKLCTSKKDPTRECAVKIMNKAKMSPSDLESVKNEIDIMRKLKHPNIVQIHDHFDEGGHIYMIIEYLAGGELFDRIVQKEHYSEKEARDVVFIFLSSLKHCHDRDIVHRDLKPENLLLASKDDDENVKIADFGLSAYNSEKGPGLLDVCGR